MKSPTFAGLALLEEIAAAHNMHGRGEALAVAIGKDTLLGMPLSLPV